MIWFLFVELILFVLVIVLYEVRSFSVCALFIFLLILLPSGLMGSFMVSKIYRRTLPYAVYSFEQVRKEKIKCTGYEDGFYVLSNGKKVRNPQSLFFRVVWGLTFLVGGGIVFFPGLFVAKKLTFKRAPEVYKLLESKPMSVKNPFDRGAN